MCDAPPPTPSSESTHGTEDFADGTRYRESSAISRDDTFLGRHGTSPRQGNRDSRRRPLVRSTDRTARPYQFHRRTTQKEKNADDHTYDRTDRTNWPHQFPRKNINQRLWTTTRTIESAVPRDRTIIRGQGTQLLLFTETNNCTVYRPYRLIVPD